MEFLGFLSENTWLFTLMATLGGAIVYRFFDDTPIYITYPVYVAGAYLVGFVLIPLFIAMVNWVSFWSTTGNRAILH